MIITTTTNASGNVDSIVVASAFFDALVLGTYPTLQVKITDSTGTEYEVSPVLSGDITVVANADDTYTILPTIISGTTTEFTSDFYKIEIWSGLTYTVLEDLGFILTDTDLECKVWQYELDCPGSKLYIPYTALVNAGACTTCNYAALNATYAKLIADLKVSCSINTNSNCGC
jgi:hypothetical protein